MLHPQAQKYIIAQKNFGYTMRAKDILCIHGASLILYGLAYLRGDVFASVPIDISSKLSVFYPMIGTTRASVGLDFIRLTTAAWVGVPAATAGDGYVDFSTNNTTRMQILKTNFLPPPNLTNYHICYYSTVDVAGTFPTQLEIGTTNGSGMLLGMNGASGTLGNLYNTTNAFISPIDIDGNVLSTANAFIVSRTDSSLLRFFYTLDGTNTFNPNRFRTSPISSASTAYAPGFLQLGGNTGGPGGTYTTRSCEGMSAGLGLNSTEAYALSAAFYYIHINK